MEQIADSICDAIESLVKSQVENIDVHKDAIKNGVKAILDTADEGQQVMAACRVYQRCGASIETLKKVLKISVFMSQSKLTTTLFELFKSANTFSAKRMTIGPESMETDADLHTGFQSTIINDIKYDFFSNVVQYIGTGNNINNAHKFCVLMENIANLFGYAQIEKMSVDVSKYKEKLSLFQLKRFYIDIPALETHIVQWANSAGLDVPHTLYTVIPRMLVNGTTPQKLYTIEELKQELQTLRSQIIEYHDTTDTIVSILSNMMHSFREAIASSNLDAEIRNVLWCDLSQTTIKALLECFKKVYFSSDLFSKAGHEKKEDTVKKLSIGFKTKFKEIIHVPFKKNAIWLKTSDDQLWSTLFECFFCQFIESTYFKAHDHDKVLYNLGLSKKDIVENNIVLRTILLNPGQCMQTISTRKNACRRIAKNCNMLGDLMQLAEYISQLDGSTTHTDPMHPYFWTLENITSLIPVPPPMTIKAHCPENMVQTPHYHSIHTTMKSFLHASVSSDCVHGYYAKGSAVPLQIERVPFDSSDVPEVFMWRPQEIVCAVDDANDIVYTEYAHIGRNATFATRVSLHDDTFSCITHDDPYAMYIKNVMHSEQTLPFWPFGENRNPYLPRIVHEKTKNMECMSDDDKESFDTAINMYCQRAWLQYYCFLNNLVCQGKNGRFLFPFSMRMIIPDSETGGGRTHSIIKSIGSPMTWTRYVYEFKTAHDRRVAMQTYACDPTFSHHGSVSVSMGNTLTKLEIAFDSSLDEDVLQLSKLKNATRIEVNTIPLTFKKCIVFSLDISNGIPNLFEFVFLSTLLHLLHTGHSDTLPKACPDGIMSLQLTERCTMLPKCDYPSPLLDVPFFKMIGSDAHVHLALDCTNDAWNAIIEKAYRLTDIHLMHTYIPLLNGMPTALHVVENASTAATAISQVRARMLNMVLRNVASCYTLNPITFSKSMNGVVQEATTLKMERAEIVFKHDVKNKVKDLKRKTPNATPRNGSKQSHDFFFISSPYLSDAPLLTYEGIMAQCSGLTMDNSVMDRILQAFGYLPLQLVPLDEEWKSPLFSRGKEHYVQLCLLHTHLMRMHLVRKEKQKILTFVGFQSVASIDMRNKTGHLVPYMSIRLQLDANLSQKKNTHVLYVPGTPMPELNVLKRQFKDGRYRMIFLTGSIKGPPFEHMHTICLENGITWRLQTSKPFDDEDALASISNMLTLIATRPSTSWEYIVAVAYIARYVCMYVEDYNATMQSYFSSVFGTRAPPFENFEIVYKEKCFNDAKQVCKAMLKYLYTVASTCKSINPLLLRDISSLYENTDIDGLIRMKYTYKDCIAFFGRVALAQVVCNIIQCPEYTEGSVQYDHSHVFEHMLAQIETLGNILLPFNERTQCDNDFAIQMFGRKKSMYFFSSISHEETLGVAFQRILRCFYSIIGLFPGDFAPSCTRVQNDVKSITEIHLTECKNAIRNLLMKNGSQPDIMVLETSLLHDAYSESTLFQYAHLNVDGVNAQRKAWWTSVTGGDMNKPKRILHTKNIVMPILKHIAITDTMKPTCTASFRFISKQSSNNAMMQGYPIFTVSSNTLAEVQRDTMFLWDIFVFMPKKGDDFIFDANILYMDSKFVFKYVYNDVESDEGYTACLSTAIPNKIVDGVSFYIADVMSTVDFEMGKSIITSSHENTANFLVIAVHEGRIVQIMHQICLLAM